MKAREAKIPPAGRFLLAEAEERVVQLYNAWGKPDQAAAWAADALYLFTVATAVEHGIERRRTPTAAHHKSPVTDYTGAVRKLYTALPAGRYPAIASMVTPLTQGDDAQRFAFAVNAIINGARNS